jgi:hypothetical protein
MPRIHHPFAAWGKGMSNVVSVITTTTNTIVVSATSAVSIGRWSNIAIIVFSFSLVCAAYYEGRIEGRR